MSYFPRFYEILIESIYPEVKSGVIMNVVINFSILNKSFLGVFSLIMFTQEPLYAAEGNEEDPSSITEENKTTSETQEETSPSEEEADKVASESTSDKPIEEKAAPELTDEHSLKLVKELLAKMKGDSSNPSYDQMLYDKVIPDHALERHGKNPSFFYNDNKFIINKIISLVMSDPDGVIDETTSTGYLKIYRDFNYPEQIEPLLKNEIRPSKKFYDEFLGQTNFGPTNRVIILIKVKGDEQNETSFEKRILYKGNNIAFIDAYPAQGPLPVKSEEGKTEVAQAEEPKTEEAQTEEPKTEEAQTEEGATEGTKTE